MRVRKLLNFKLNLITDGHYILKVIMFNFIYIYIYIYMYVYTEFDKRKTNWCGNQDENCCRPLFSTCI